MEVILKLATDIKPGDQLVFTDKDENQYPTPPVVEVKDGTGRHEATLLVYFNETSHLRIEKTTNYRVKVPTVVDVLKRSGHAPSSVLAALQSAGYKVVRA